MKGAISTQEIDDEELLKLAIEQESIETIDLVDKVSVTKPKIFGEEIKIERLFLTVG